jgi:hypothetical protein
MPTVLFRPGSHRWFVPVILGIIVLLPYVALPGGSLRMLAKDIDLAKNVRTKITALNAVHIGFPRACAAERDVLVGQSPPAHQASAAGIRCALDTTEDKAGPASEAVRALWSSVETYAQTFAPTVVVGPGTKAVFQPWPANASADAIDAMLGRLQTDNEALLREPLVGMRLAATAFLSEGKSQSARQLSRWAEIFTTRLNEMTIPEGTRANLARMLATYEHGVVDTNNALFPRQHEGEIPQVGNGAMETAMANAARASTAEPTRLIGFDDCSVLLSWSRCR